jgi:Lytic polysaccharide mono-oxygenase, cellulose-degrading
MRHWGGACAASAAAARRQAASRGRTARATAIDLRRNGLSPALKDIARGRRTSAGLSHCTHDWRAPRSATLRRAQPCLQTNYEKRVFFRARRGPLTFAHGDLSAGPEFPRPALPRPPAGPSPIRFCPIRIMSARTLEPAHSSAPPSAVAAHFPPPYRPTPRRVAAAAHFLLHFHPVVAATIHSLPPPPPHSPPRSSAAMPPARASTLLAAALALAALATTAAAHGMITDPRGRGAVNCQRNVYPKVVDSSAPIDYCPMCLNMGGINAVRSASGGSNWSPYKPMQPGGVKRGGLGICGDPAGSSDHMKWGRFGPTLSQPYVRRFTPGEAANFEFDATANHGGYLEFYLCDVSNNPGQEIRFETFGRDCHYLERVPTDSCEGGGDMECGYVALCLGKDLRRTALCFRDNEYLTLSLSPFPILS